MYLHTIKTNSCVCVTRAIIRALPPLCLSLSLFTFYVLSRRYGNKSFLEEVVDPHVVDFNVSNIQRTHPYFHFVLLYD